MKAEPGNYSVKGADVRLYLSRWQMWLAVAAVAATAVSAWCTCRQAHVAAKTLKFEKAKYELAVRAGRQP